MGIYEIDPINTSLYLNRFYKPERVTPCIDTDFQQSRRQEVIQYIQDKYGYAYPVRTFGFQDKNGSTTHDASVVAWHLNYMTTLKNINDMRDTKDKVKYGQYL